MNLQANYTPNAAEAMPDYLMPLVLSLTGEIIVDDARIESAMISNPDRYSPVAKFIRDQYSPGASIVIADFNVALGEAVTGLCLKLRDEYDIHLHIHDIKLAAIQNTKRRLTKFGIAPEVSTTRDLLQATDPNYHVNIGVIGNIHHYINAQDLAALIQRRLEECDYLCYVPFLSTKDSLSSAEDGTRMYSAYIISASTKQVSIINEILPRL